MARNWCVDGSQCGDIQRGNLFHAPNEVRKDKQALLGFRRVQTTKFQGLHLPRPIGWTLHSPEPGQSSQAHVNRSVVHVNICCTC